MKKILLLGLLWISKAYAQPVVSPFFEQHNDVGGVRLPGDLRYRPEQQEYEISASGSNIWLDKDEFHFAWRKLKGDFILQARVRFLGEGKDPHRKVGWMIRDELSTASVMTAVTVHGDGLTALQFRKESGKNVEEIRSTVSAPDMIQLERRGKRLLMSVARFGDPYQTVSVTQVPSADEVYAGLFVCSHNNEVLEKAIFSNVQIIIPTPPGFQPYKDYLGSHIETLDVSSGHRVIQHTDWQKSLQAPNWMPDGKSLLYNSEGLIYQFRLDTKTHTVLPTDYVKQNNNDHVISFDGKMLGLSSSSGKAQDGSLVYLVPVQGGKPRQITPSGPSYLHGFSPDGKWMTYTGQRNNEFDIYKITTDGTPEIRLTQTPGLDDGSEYSPDGRFIYFNSVRSGSMQLWRMKPDGSGAEQLTHDEYNNWFPHISPDGRWMVFLSYSAEVAPGDHPFYKHIYLRMMPADASTPPHVIAYVYGGQGTINTPSWSPDSKKVAFVSNSGKW